MRPFLIGRVQGQCAVEQNQDAALQVRRVQGMSILSLFNRVITAKIHSHLCALFSRQKPQIPSHKDFGFWLFILTLNTFVTYRTRLPR